MVVDENEIFKERLVFLSIYFKGSSTANTNNLCNPQIDFFQIKKNANSENFTYSNCNLDLSKHEIYWQN